MTETWDNIYDAALQRHKDGGAELAQLVIEADKKMRALSARFAELERKLDEANRACRVVEVQREKFRREARKKGMDERERGDKQERDTIDRIIAELERERDNARTRLAAAYEKHDPSCTKCGHRLSEHHYRHPFVTHEVGPSATDADRDALSERDARIRAEERERCAKIADLYADAVESAEPWHARRIADAIRAQEDE